MPDILDNEDSTTEDDSSEDWGSDEDDDSGDPIEDSDMSDSDDDDGDRDGDEEDEEDDLEEEEDGESEEDDEDNDDEDEDEEDDEDDDEEDDEDENTEDEDENDEFEDDEDEKGEEENVYKDKGLYDEEAGMLFVNHNQEEEEIIFEPSPYQDEPIDQEEKKEKDPVATRKAILACFLCCVCLLIVAAAVVLGLFFTNDANDSNPTPGPITLLSVPEAPAPTFVSPTLSPGVMPPSRRPLPTGAPSISLSPTRQITTTPSFQPSLFPSANPTKSFEPTDSVPDELLILPDEDTFIYVDGFTQAESYGTEETLLVQNGPNAVNEVPDAYTLLTFDLEKLPQPWRITDREPQAILRLTHIVRELSDDLSNSTLTVIRLPQTPLAVETLHGMLFTPTSGIQGPSFTIDPTDQRVEVDITALIFDQPPFVPDVRYSRDLQGSGTQLFLMIENQGPEQPDGGNRFASRESATPPELYIGLFLPGVPRPTKAPTLSPSLSPRPTITARPTNVPTVTAPPSNFPNTTEAPSSLLNETEAPSSFPNATEAPSNVLNGTEAPSNFLNATEAPSSFPSTSLQPSSSAAPTILNSNISNVPTVGELQIR